MSLMERMRSGSDSTFMQIVAVAIVVSFVGWGVGVSGNSAATVASVNGEAISDIDFGQAYRAAENQRSSRSDTPLTPDEREALREQVVQQLVRQKALLQEAEALGLEISSKEIAEQLLELPFLLDEEGRFDKAAYYNFLRQRGTTRANFEEQIREDLLVQKLQELMILGASVTDVTVKQRYVDANTKLDLQFVRLRPAAFQERYEPSADEVAKLLADRADDVRARYDDDRVAKYDLPETLDLRLIRLAVRDDGLGLTELRAKLETLKQQLDGGADFADLARRWSEDPSAADGGLVSGQEVTDLAKPTADAVAKIQPGQLSDIVVGDADLRLLKLEARTPAREIPFDEVKEDIARALLREEQGPALAAAFAEKELLPAWQTAKAPPAELLATQGLEVQSTGPIPASASGGLLRPPDAMLQAARTAAVGTVLPEVYEHEGILWVGALVTREDPDMTEFEAEKAQIREQALLARRYEFFQAWVDDVVARATVKR